MKLSEIRPCDACGGVIAPIFYVVRASLALFNRQAVNETMGLTQMFGGTRGALAIAEVMGARTDDVVTVVADKEPKLLTEIFICQRCYTEKIVLAIAAEHATSARRKSSPEGGEEDEHG